MNIRIYEDDGMWVVWDRDTDIKATFATQQEALEMTSKSQLAQAIIYQAQLHTKAMDENGDVLQEYFDAGVVFEDADVESLGVTAAEVVACVVLLENAGKFYGGNSPANATYRVTINAIRRVAT